MRRPLALLCLAAGLGAALLAARPQDGQAPPPGMARYWLGLIRKGPTWSAERTEEAAALSRGHREAIGRLVESGQLVLAGPFEGHEELAGLVVYAVDSEEQARALADSDPAVAAGRLAVELVAWWGPAELQELAALERASRAAAGAPHGPRDADHHEGDLPHGGGHGAADQDGNGGRQAAVRTLTDAVVEASCGECQFGLPGDDCSLAIRLHDEAFFVDGTDIDDHGDAHAGDGFCNAIRKARVSGRFEGDRFLATSFALLPEGDD